MVITVAARSDMQAEGTPWPSRHREALKPLRNVPRHTTLRPSAEALVCWQEHKKPTRRR